MTSHNVGSPSGDGLNKGNLAQDLFKANDKATSVASILNRTEQSVPSQSGSQKTTKTFEGKNFKINSQGPYVNNSGGSKGTGPPNFPVNSCHCMGIECEKCGKSDINSSVPVSSIALGSVATVVLPVVAVETRPPNARDWFAEKMFSDSEAEVNGRRHDVAEKVGLVWEADVKTKTYADNGEKTDRLGAGSLDISNQESIVPSQNFVYTNSFFPHVMRFPIGRDDDVSTPEPDDPATDGRGTAPSGDVTTNPSNPIRPTEAGRTVPTHHFIHKVRDTLNPGSAVKSRCPPTRVVQTHLEAEAKAKAEVEIEKYEEVRVRMPGTSKVFANVTKVTDSRSDKRQIAEECRDLTFTTTVGRFRYCREPRSLTSSSNEFCRRTDEDLSGKKLKIADDNGVAANDCGKSRTRINKTADKMEIGRQIRFAGYKVLRRRSNARRRESGSYDELFAAEERSGRPVITRVGQPIGQVHAGTCAVSASSGPLQERCPTKWEVSETALNDLKSLLTRFPSSRLSNPYDEFREAAGDSNREIIQAISGGVEAWSLPPSNPGRQLDVLWSELAASDDVPYTYRGRTVVPVRARAKILRKTRQARSLYHRPWGSVDACNTKCMHQPCQEMLPSKPRPAARGDEVDKPMEETSVDLPKALENVIHENGYKPHKGARKARFAWNNVTSAKSQRPDNPNNFMFGRIPRYDLPLPLAPGPGKRISGKEAKGAFTRGFAVVIQDPLVRQRGPNRQGPPKPRLVSPSIRSSGGDVVT